MGASGTPGTGGTVSTWAFSITRSGRPPGNSAIRLPAVAAQRGGGVVLAHGQPPALELGAQAVDDGALAQARAGEGAQGHQPLAQRAPGAPSVGSIGVDVSLRDMARSLPGRRASP
jgi:hypothetical protein